MENMYFCFAKFIYKENEQVQKFFAGLSREETKNNSGMLSSTKSHDVMTPEEYSKLWPVNQRHKESNRYSNTNKWKESRLKQDGLSFNFASERIQK